jgi:hypothetical protein
MHRFRDLAIPFSIYYACKNNIAISTMIRAPQPPNDADADIGMVRMAMHARRHR